MSYEPAVPWGEAFSDPKNQFSFTAFGQTTVVPTWSFVDRVLDDHLIYFVVHHAVAGAVDDQPLQLKAGALIWLSPGIRHTVRNNDPQRPVTVIHLRPNLRMARTRQPPQPMRLILPEAWELQSQVESLLAETRSQRDYGPLRARLMLAGLLIDAARLHRRDQTFAGLTASQRERLMDRINRDPTVRLTTVDLADHLGLSHDYFARQFQRSFGVSPRRWLVQQRIRRAAEHLLESNLSISQIADAFGYPDLFQFSRQFKVITGQSPRDYRRGR